jgi:hypothetical protein
MPLAAPVTMQTFPSNSMEILSSDALVVRSAGESLGVLSIPRSRDQSTVGRALSAPRPASARWFRQTLERRSEPPAMLESCGCADASVVPF